MNSKPLITVITSTYNAAETLERCLVSLENQTYKKFELLIIDGGSTDGTIDIIEKFTKKGTSHISWWVSEPDNGIFNAWNKALPHVRGEWVYFLGADDYLYSSETLEVVKEYLIKCHPFYSVMYGKVAMVSCHNQDEIRWIGEPWDLIKYSFFNLGNTLPHQGLFQHRDTFNCIGIFNEKYQIAGDYDMLLRVLINTEPLFIDVPIAYMRTGGISSLLSSELIIRQEYLDIHWKNNRISNLRYFHCKIILMLWSIVNKISPKFFVFMRNIFRSIKGKKPYEHPTDF